MSVYIKGMEMPKGCFFCIFNKHLDPDTDMCILTRDAFDSTFRVVEHRRDNCPLVPVPEHGRLIDADDFLRRAIGTKCFRGDYALMLEELVGESTTIIPAEEGET